MRGIYTILSISFALIASPLRAEPLYNKPVYNPETKSYFELYAPDPVGLLKGDQVQSIKWTVAAKMARARTHKGVRGRLAVVKTRQVHEFLRDTFQPNAAAWIGLRYWCKFKKLQWVTGEIYPTTAYAAWGQIWNEGAIYPGQKDTAGAICGFSVSDPGDHAGVHYWSIKQGFHWNANGRDKYWSAMFIEYPTGKP